MRRSVVMLIALCACAPACLWGASGRTYVRVKGDRANLRALPSFNSEVVAQAEKGSVLCSTRAEGEWVQVVPPQDTVNLWVHSAMVQEGVVTASKVHVRVGPGINYSVVGELAKGASVTQRGTFVDWLKIAPPPGCFVWIHQMLVEPADEREARSQADAAAGAAAAARDVRAPRPPPDGGGDADTAETRQDAAAQPASGAATEGAPRPPPDAQGRPQKPDDAVAQPRPEAQGVAHQQPAAAAARVRLPKPHAAAQPAAEQPTVASPVPPARPQPALVRVSGVVRPTNFVLRQPGRYRLTEPRSGREVTVCYLRGAEDELAARVGQRVTVHGRAQAGSGIDLPVVLVERVAAP